MAIYHAYADQKLKDEDGNLVPTPHSRSITAAADVAEPGDVIMIHGDHYQEDQTPNGPWSKGYSIGTHQSSGNRIGKDQGVVGITFMGADENARTGPWVISQKVGNNHNITFKNLNIHVPYGQYGVIHHSGQIHMDFDYINVKVTTGGATKWAFRFHGPTKFNLIDTECTTGSQEHFVYADNVQGDCNIWNCKAANHKRTAVQIVNRQESGPSGFGKIDIKELDAKDCGQNGGGGITISGHLGTVFARNCVVESKFDTYGMVVWREGADPKKGKLGAYKNAGGYATNMVAIHRCKFIVPNTKRGCVAMSSVENVIVSPNLFEAKGKPAIQFAVPKYGGGFVGDVQFRGKDPVNWPGWNAAGKISVQGKMVDDGWISQRSL